MQNNWKEDYPFPGQEDKGKGVLMRGISRECGIMFNTPTYGADTTGIDACVVLCTVAV